MVDALESSNNKAKGVAFVGEEVTDAELKAMDRAGVRGVRFNFVRRLVDFTPREVLERIAARIAPLGWHIVIYFEMPDLPELESFFTSLPTTVVVDHMGTPDVRKGVDHPENQRFHRMMAEHQNFWVKVTCPERMSVAGPPYDDVVPFAKSLVDEVSRPRHLGHRLAASQHEEGSARRRLAGRSHPAYRDHARAAEAAASRQSDAAVLGLAGTAIVRSAWRGQTGCANSVSGIESIQT